MSGILIIAHAPLASAMREAVAHVFPERMEQVLALDVQAQANPQDSLVQAQQLADQLGTEPVLVLTDVMGATPCNVARNLCQQHAGRLLTGVNIPMLWRAVSYQQETLDTLVDRALQGGSHGVMEVPVTPAAA
jgi:PTS system mannose-specific IIA component